MRTNYLLSTIIAITLLVAGFAYFATQTPSAIKESPQVINSDPREIETAAAVSPIIPTKVYEEKTAQTDATKPLNYKIPVLSETTVLRAMESYSAVEPNFSFSGREFSGLGLMIEEIGGKKNGGGFYWTLFINNILSEQGATSAEVNSSSIVEWRYQKGI